MPLLAADSTCAIWCLRAFFGLWFYSALRSAVANPLYLLCSGIGACNFLVTVVSHSKPPSGDLDFLVTVVSHSKPLFVIFVSWLPRATGSLAGGFLVAVAGCALVAVACLCWVVMNFELVRLLWWFRTNGTGEPCWTHIFYTGNIHILRKIWFSRHRIIITLSTLSTEESCVMFWHLLGTDSFL